MAENAASAPTARKGTLLTVAVLTLLVMLSLPGIQVRAADETPLLGETEHGAAICPALPLAQSGPSFDQLLAAAGPQERGVAVAGDESGRVSLNNRGYNYGPARSQVDPALLQYELRGGR